MTSSPDPRRLASARAIRLLNSLDFQLRRTLKRPDADQVHDLRVATRRFTQALVIFESCFLGVHGIRKKLKLPMTLSGKVRDIDIVLEVLGDSRAAVAAKTVKRVERERAKSERALIKTLGKIVESGAVQAWRGKLASPHRKTAAHVPAHAVDIKVDIKQAVLHAAERFFDRGDQAYERRDSDSKDSSPKNSSSDLHRLRIATKKLRYTLELAIPPDARSRNGLDRVEQLQSDLGKIHDFEPVHKILSEHRGARRLLVRLAKKQHKRIRDFREYWKNEFGGEKNRADWMRRITVIADSFLFERPSRKAPASTRRDPRIERAG